MDDAQKPDPRYPIGKFKQDGPIGADLLAAWIDEIEALPLRWRQVVEALDDDQLDTPYRAGGWTIRQLVHHLPDSHLNAYVRFKLALTEDEPTIKPYDEKRWAALPDRRIVPVAANLDFLTLLHAKWVVLLRAMTPEQFSRRYLHPERGPVELRWAVGSYAWHGRHHLAHVERGVVSS